MSENETDRIGCKQIVIEMLQEIPSHRASVGELAAACGEHGFSRVSASTMIARMVRTGVLVKHGWGWVELPDPEPSLLGPQGSLAKVNAKKTSQARAEVSTGPKAIPWPTANEMAYEQDRKDNWAAILRGYKRIV